MLPSATHSRNKRERNGASGRTQEIQRLIGRSLRSIIDLNKLGERTIQIDCDVMVADGGTRTTSISGAYVALAIAMKKLMNDGLIKENPLSDQLAAISVGITKDGNIIAQNLIKLSQCSQGKPYIFSAVTVSDDDFLTYLNEKKLQLGDELEIIKIEKYDQSMTVEIEKNKEVLSLIVCQKILVK